MFAYGLTFVPESHQTDHHQQWRLFNVKNNNSYDPTLHVSAVLFQLRDPQWQNKMMCSVKCCKIGPLL